MAQPSTPTMMPGGPPGASGMHSFMTPPVPSHHTPPEGIFSPHHRPFSPTAGGGKHRPGPKLPYSQERDFFSVSRRTTWSDDATTKYATGSRLGGPTCIDSTERQSKSVTITATAAISQRSWWTTATYTTNGSLYGTSISDGTSDTGYTSHAFTNTTNTTFTIDSTISSTSIDAINATTTIPTSIWCPGIPTNYATNDATTTTWTDAHANAV